MKLNNIFSKRTLYVLCFLALNLIEVLRGSMPGNIWAAATNCTGLVMFVIILSAYPIKDFLNLFNGIYTVICAVAMVAVHFHYQQHVGEYYWGQTQTAILNIWWIGMVVRYLFKKVVVEKSITLKPGKIGWMWILLTVLMIASVSGRWWPLWFFLMFGSFYLTKFTKEDSAALWDGMINGTILAFFAVQIYAYGFRPYDEIRYKGAFINCNVTALYYLIIYMMCLIKLHLLEQKKAKKGWKLFYLIGAGGLLSFQIFTLCRTAWVASLVLTVLYGIYVVRRIWQKKWYQVLLRGAGLVLAVLVTFLPVYYSIRWLPTVLHRPVWYEGEYTTNKVHSYDPADSEKYVDLDTFLNLFIGRIKYTLRNMQAVDPFALQSNAAGIEVERVERVKFAELDKALGGRLSIYKAYWDDLTWYGNGMEKGHYIIGDGDYQTWHAQNLWLQIGYYFGIPAGTVFLLFTFILLYFHKKNLRKTDVSYGITPFFVCIVYFMFGLMEVVWNPGQLIMFLFFFAHHPQMRGEGNDLEPVSVAITTKKC
ncbi:MAG: hypothetical protein E7293_04580 [Lachnospiraceae bacterium]|nr:hypothetical protein [Lachnospiraceae bacterium]